MHIPTIVKCEILSIPWMGVPAFDFANVKTSLAEISDYFHMPVLQFDRSLWIIFDTPNSGPIGICGDNIDSTSGVPELTSDEIEQALNTRLGFPFYCGSKSDPELVKSFVQKIFPKHMEIDFF